MKCNLFREHDVSRKKNCESNSKSQETTNNFKGRTAIARVMRVIYCSGTKFGSDREVTADNWAAVEMMAIVPSTAA